jgi:hypothetical protein
VLLELLNASKKKSIKDLLKRLHEIDRPGGPLDKVIKFYYNLKKTEYYDRFNMWRVVNYQGGFVNMSTTSKSLKDPIIESIYKGTDVVEEEKTVERSYEKRLEKRRAEIAEHILQKKQQKQKMVGGTNRSHGSSQKRLKLFKGGSDDHDSGLPPIPVFNSLPPNMEFIHRMLIKCADPKFMEEKK